MTAPSGPDGLPAVMDDLLAGETAKRAVRELTIAVVATVVTLVAAVGLYLFVPTVQDALRTRDAELQHDRRFEATPTGGRIVYVVPASAENRAARLEHYTSDLEVLKRRFERGQFEIALLPGLKDSEIMKQMNRHAAGFRYAIERGDQAVTLTIVSPGGVARQSLHSYLKYLNDGWVLQR